MPILIGIIVVLPLCMISIPARQKMVAVEDTNIDE
jgi:hypothetical protein